MSRVSDIISSQEDANLRELAENSVEDIKQRSIAGVLSYTLRTFAVQFIAVFANFFLAAYLSRTEYGVYFLVTAALNLFTFLSDIGLAASLIQKKEEPTVTDLRTTFTVQMVLSLFIFGLSVALTPLWQRMYGFSGPDLWLLYVVGFTFVMISFKTIPSVLLLRKLRYDLLSVPGVVENLVFYTVLCLCAWQGLGIRSFIFAILLRDAFGVGLMYAIQRWPIGLTFSWQSFRGMVNFGAKFQLNDLIARVKDDLFTLVVMGAFLDTSQIGLVSWSKKMASMPQQFTVNNIIAITFATYSRLQHRPDLLKKAIEKTLYFVSLVTFPMLAGLSIFIVALVELVPRYEQWKPALLGVSLFAVNYAWAAISTPLTNTLNAVGKVNRTLVLMIMWTGLTWTITPLAIIFFGYNGVALASAIISFSSIVTIMMVKAVIPFDFWRNIWRQLVATLAMGIIGVMGMPLWQQSFFNLALGIVLTGTVFAIVFLGIGWRSLVTELTSLGIWPKIARRFQSS